MTQHLFVVFIVIVDYWNGLVLLGGFDLAVLLSASGLLRLVTSIFVIILVLIRCVGNDFFLII
jgi:hypothetical protein